jgi:hypothetical protein
MEKVPFLRNLSLDKKGYWSVDFVKSGRVAQGESTAFTRQGSEVQILSRLPGKTGREAVHWMAFLFLKWAMESSVHAVVPCACKVNA